jgi:hypothetical protein
MHQGISEDSVRIDRRKCILYISDAYNVLGASLRQSTDQFDFAWEASDLAENDVSFQNRF